MSAILFDTAKAARSLESAGMPRNQAVATVEVVTRYMEYLRSKPGMHASPEAADIKPDIEALQAALDSRFARLDKRLAELEKRLDAIPRLITTGLVAVGLLHVLLNVFGLIRHWFNG
jgi:ribose 5-phosphate isomerase